MKIYTEYKPGLFSDGMNSGELGEQVAREVAAGTAVCRSYVDTGEPPEVAEREKQRAKLAQLLGLGSVDKLLIG